MKIDDITNIRTDELPLDNLLENGGYTNIFPTIACIGDSLSSGEFEYVDPNNNRFFIDKFEFSWGQYIAKMTGNKVYNFSRGGMSAKEYMESFGQDNNLFSLDKKASAYIIALGVNDLLCLNMPLGDTKDIDISNYQNNKDTFAGWYGQIISKYKEINPHAKFFFVSMPKENNIDDSIKEKHSKLLHDLTKIYTNSYVIDLYKYAPIYDEEFKNKFYLEGHMNPAGYYLTAILISSYIDYIIRKDFKAFKQVGFIGCKEYKSELD